MSSHGQPPTPDHVLFEVRGWTGENDDGEVAQHITVLFDTFEVVMNPEDAIHIATQLIGAAIKTTTMSNMYAALTTADVPAEPLDALMQLAAATPQELPDLLAVLHRWGGLR